jgi:hypothetical protein
MLEEAVVPWTVRCIGIDNCMLDTGVSRFTDFDLNDMAILEQIASDHNELMEKATNA